MALSLKGSRSCRPTLQRLQAPQQIVWMLLAIVLLLRVVWAAVSKTMFFDGMIYASLARNIAEGVGSLWHPHFSDGLFPVFYEHPPLMFAMESVGFFIFGDSIWVEKAFTIIITLLCCLCFIGIWMRLNEDDPQLRLLGAFPLILALIAGRVGWAFSNNMLENPLILFTLTATYLVLTAYREDRRPTFLSRLPWLLTAGVAIALALFTKGPVGLFPLASIGIYALAFRQLSLRTVIADTIVLVLVVLGIVALFVLFPEPRANMVRYLDGQVISSLSGERGHGGGGLKGLWSLIRVNLWPLMVGGVFLGIAYAMSRKAADGKTFSAAIPSSRRNIILFFLLVGLSASVPLLISPRIHNFYFNPALFYFSAAISTAVIPAFLYVVWSTPEWMITRIKFGLTIIVVASAMLVAGSVGSAGRDKATIGDVEAIASAVCSNSASSCDKAILVCGTVWENWRLHAYLQRLHKISLFSANTVPGPFANFNYLIGDASCAAEVFQEFRQPVISLSNYQLYEQ